MTRLDESTHLVGAQAGICERGPDELSNLQPRDRPPKGGVPRPQDDVVGQLVVIAWDLHATWANDGPLHATRLQRLLSPLLED